MDTFEYPVTADFCGRGAVRLFVPARRSRPASTRCGSLLTDPDGREMGEASLDLAVPEVLTPFRPEMAPGDASTLPTAEAIVIADESAAKPAAAGRAEAQDPASRAGDADRPAAPRGRRRAADRAASSSTSRTSASSTRTRPPYSVEIDLGNVPRRQTLRAVGYDETGAVSSTRTRARSTRARPASPSACCPAWTPRGQGARQGGRPVDHRRRRQEGRALPRRPEDRLAGRRLPTRRRSPTRSTRTATILRATAITEDGKEANDIRMLKGPQTTGRERARRRRAAPRLRARQGRALRQGARARTTSRSRRTASREPSRPASRSPRTCR